MRALLLPAACQRGRSPPREERAKRAPSITPPAAQVADVEHGGGRSVMQCEDGSAPAGSLVLDATGHSRRLVKYDRPFNPGESAAPTDGAGVLAHALPPSSHALPPLRALPPTPAPLPLTPPSSHAGYQGAYGIVVEVESHPFDCDTMLFMDWRDDHLDPLPEVKARNAK